MLNAFVEPSPKGRPQGSATEDYVVEDHADHALATTTMQREAIKWAKKNGHTPLVARVRHLNDKNAPRPPARCLGRPSPPAPNVSTENRVIGRKKRYKKSVSEFVSSLLCSASAQPL